MYNHHCRFLCRIHSSSRTITSHHHNLFNSFLQNPSSLSSLASVRFISSIDNTTKQPNEFTTDYLINSCGLSPESALKTSKYIALKPSNTKNPDSVLSLFKTYGFTLSHISKIVAIRPLLLLANPDKIVKPKLDFYSNIGISGSDLGKFLSRNHHFLVGSLQNKIIPFINFLRSILKSDSCIAKSLTLSRWGLIDAQSVIMERNISILRDHGVPEDNISKYVLMSSNKLCVNSDQFNKMILEVKNMGFISSSMMFLHGLSRLLETKKSTWDARVAVYRSFGWSEDEVILMFKKQPNIVRESVKKLNSALDFFLNNLKWTRIDVFKNPTLLSLSLEKRVIPRLCVLHILHSKYLISKNGMGKALRVSEDVFLKKYVIKHQSKLPELLELYKNKIGRQV
ncbi:Mitochondrial transcription termination factor family protein [Thalictrum thalictroides]|uniref:Mitochondrial transcription termination factor family protein n=1 Tax=Thalictrum thalictroides TaxID=46969 RepID=A0A7J6V9X7_THATH|nr:Mitochondrial transcription termination factor family protein [Thalictrum thalictroides]